MNIALSGIVSLPLWHAHTHSEKNQNRWRYCISLFSHFFYWMGEPFAERITYLMFTSREIAIFRFRFQYSMYEAMQNNDVIFTQNTDDFND